MTDTQQFVELQQHGTAVLLQFKRPQKLNAFSTAFEQEILTAVQSNTVKNASAVVFMGTEMAFSAGADTSELPEMSAERIAEYYRDSGAVYNVISQLPQPTIAAVSGYCLGAGFELALACDIRVAADNAQFGLPELALGILPSSGGLTRLVRATGPAVAREIILLGERFSARRAHELSLVLEVVNLDQLQSVALQRAEQLAQQPPLALAWTKAAIDMAAESSTHASQLIEQLAYAALNRVQP